MAVNKLLIVALLIGCGTQIAQAYREEPKAPSKPVFDDNYHVHGLLSLPYAELNEPFNAFYDKQSDRSRADYYGGEYKVYQFGSKSSPEGADSAPYGAIYKLVYVPKSFRAPGEAPVSDKLKLDTLEGRLSDTYKYATDRLHELAKAVEGKRNKKKKTNEVGEADENDETDEGQEQDIHIRTSRTPIKRACFGVKGEVGFTVRAQTVLPDLSDFSYDSTGPCPLIAGGKDRKHRCELWKYSNEPGIDKRNYYSFWLRREANRTIPVHYEMLGYDTLLGSHYDRYLISYWGYQVGGARDEDFAFDIKGNKCGSMPGPGNPADEAQVRAHLSEQNPIHQFVVAPHRYDHIDHHYAEFKSKFGGGARDERWGWFNFLHNLRFIHGKNRELKEFKLAVNKFADQNVRADLRYLRGRLHSRGYNGGLDYEQEHKLKGNSGVVSSLPDEFDWEPLGGVTRVKDQAVCGSCWSFGTVGTIEGNYFAKTGKLLRLSEQQLVDCSWQYGNNGCDGGEDFRAYEYIKAAGGLATDEDYGRYKGIDGKCHDQDVERQVKISGFYNVTTNSVEALKHAIVTKGPVSISIDASSPTFTFYSIGPYYDAKCANSPDKLDHSVLAVGYYHLNGKLVWKVKNSWSTYWGDEGYVHMLADNNNCGVLTAPTVPIIAS